MVKKIILIFLFLYISGHSFAQKKRDFWWLRSCSNKKYEKSYKYLVSNIEKSVLKHEIEKFIKLYIASSRKDEEEIAIEVIVLPQKKIAENRYNITYIPNYYNIVGTPTNNYQQITMVKDKIVFVKNHNLKDIRIKKEILYGLLRDRYPKICKKNNTSYTENNGLITESWILEHQIANWVITIKEGELIDKKISFE